MRTVQHTKDYDSFHMMPMNRSVKESHVQTMGESIAIFGMPTRPVIVCETDEIDGILRRWVLDGQHLLQALIRDKKEIPYITIPVKDAKDIVHKLTLLNNTSKSWGLLDYINAYRNFDKTYDQLFKMVNKYQTETLFVASMGLNKNSSNVAITSKILRKGEYNIENPNWEAMCEQFQQIYFTIGSADRWVKKAAYDCFLNTFGYVDHTKVIRNVVKHISTAKSLSDPAEGREFINKKIFKAA